MSHEFIVIAVVLAVISVLVLLINLNRILFLKIKLMKRELKKE